MTGTIFDIVHASFVDGPGIRTTVFFKGCNLACRWCHNPESQSVKPEKLYYADRCRHCGRCQAVCPSPENCILCGKCAKACLAGALSLCGKETTEDEVMKAILSDAPFYGDDGGATFSGGECMLQPAFLLALLKKCKENGVHTAVDTAGNLPWNNFEAILPYTDLILYDVKVMDNTLHKKWTGVGNERILENLASLLRRGVSLWVRVPVIPGVNDSVENMLALRAFLEAQPHFPEKIELLPYHALGENKYRALGKEPTQFEVPSEGKLNALRAIFE